MIYWKQFTFWGLSNPFLTTQRFRCHAIFVQFAIFYCEAGNVTLGNNAVWFISFPKLAWSAAQEKRRLTSAAWQGSAIFQIVETDIMIKMRYKEKATLCPSRMKIVKKNGKRAKKGNTLYIFPDLGPNTDVAYAEKTWLTWVDWWYQIRQSFCFSLNDVGVNFHFFFQLSVLVQFSVIISCFIEVGISQGKGCYCSGGSQEEHYFKSDESFPANLESFQTNWAFISHKYTQFI